MDLLMERTGMLKRPVLAPVMGLTLWLAGASLSMGNEVDPALHAAFGELFPALSSSRNLSPKSGSSRDPQVLEMRNGEVLLGYGVALHPVSRSGPFHIVVAVSPEETVMDVEIPKYPHRRGRGVRKQAFLDQFKGVSYGDSLRLGKEIDGVSGATSSATAITVSVRHALFLVHRYQRDKK